MVAQGGLGHPYSDIDLAELDRGFLSLLAHAGKRARGRRATAGRGLRIGEKLLFRFGVFVGQGEWDLAREAVGSLMQDGLLSGPEVERAAAEAVMIRGWPGCTHLGRTLEAMGLRTPGSVVEAVEWARGTPGTSVCAESGVDGLTEREIFALGLGVTWGARCWDT